MSWTQQVAIILGTRPEAIKLSPVVRAMRAHDRLNTRLITTGQHREMLDQILRVFDLTADEDLGLMRPDQSLADLTARSIGAIDRCLADPRPDWVMVQGDTTTVFCAALCAYYQRIPVAHVEAGLRTHDKYAPFPEEINRVLTSHLGDLHFAPTAGARDNLVREGIPAERIHVTGNTVIDALLAVVEQVRRRPLHVPGLPAPLQPGHDDPPLVLITGHRRENFGPGLQAVCRAIRTLAAKHRNTAFVYPVHLNPNVQAPVHAALAGLPNVHLIAPLDYLAFVALMDRCTLVLTDSGGIQEEAPSLGKPVLVMREVTERPEGVAAGTVRLVGTNETRIVEEVDRLLTDPSERIAMARAVNPYGDGQAAERIVAVLAAEANR